MGLWRETWRWVLRELKAKVCGVGGVIRFGEVMEVVEEMVYLEEEGVMAIRVVEIVRVSLGKRDQRPCWINEDVVVERENECGGLRCFRPSNLFDNYLTTI